MLSIISFFLLQKAEYKAAAGKGNNTEEASDSAEDCSAGRYGFFGMINSKDKHEERKFVAVHDLSEHVGKDAVWVRGRVHNTRAKGKQCFLILRQQSSTVQCIAAVGDQISKQLVKFAGK